MSVAGLCEVCETRPVIGGCERCGKLVCEEHMDEETEYCTACYAEVYGREPWREGEDGNDRKRRRDRPDGVGEFRF